MASQKVRNILNNQIDAIIVRAKAEVKNEGKKKLNELKSQLLNPQTIVSRLRTEIGPEGCSTKGNDKFMKKWNQLNNTLTDVEELIDKGLKKLTEVEEKIGPIIEEAGPIKMIKDVVTITTPIVQILNAIVNVAPIGLAASSGPAASGVTIDTLGKKIDYGKAKVQEYLGLFTAIPVMILSYVAQAKQVFTILNRAKAQLQFIKDEIVKLKLFLANLLINYQRDCGQFLVDQITNAEQLALIEEMNNQQNQYPKQITDINGNTINVYTQDEEFIINLTIQNAQSVLNYLQTIGAYEGIERVYKLDEFFGEEYNLSFKKINPITYTLGIDKNNTTTTTSTNTNQGSGLSSPGGSSGGSSGGGYGG